MTKHSVLIVFVLQAVVCTEIAKGQEVNYWNQGSIEELSPLNLKEIEAIQFSFGSRLFQDAIYKQHSIEVESLILIRIDK